MGGDKDGKFLLSKTATALAKSEIGRENSDAGAKTPVSVLATKAEESRLRTEEVQQEMQTQISKIKQLKTESCQFY